MNRLVIIGNGFDLAHGLPTRYKDFIEDYFISAANNFTENRSFEDELIRISYKSSISFSTKPIFQKIEDVFTFLKNNSSYVEMVFKSQFLKSLKDKLNHLNWIDVENEYFEQLKNCKIRNKEDFDYDKVAKLNSDFNCIKIKLEEYLSNIIRNNQDVINPNRFISLFCQPILKEEVLLVELDKDKTPDKLHLLNFNYTNILEHYYEDCNKIIPTEMNYIHGELNYLDNPIIFGFGDEYDKNYKDFEDKKNNLLFEHIKSFGYFKTKNYHNLIRFLNEDYQVYILGHSCGLSDRTMLKEIFENEKCKSIKIFYYCRSQNINDNDYVEKTMEISRHFEDKGLMRKKIVSFHLSTKI